MQLVEHRSTLGFAQLWEFLDDLRCAHGKIIASGVRFVRERKVRDREDTVASTRDARAPRNSFYFDFDWQQVIDHIRAAIGIAM